MATSEECHCSDAANVAVDVKAINAVVAAVIHCPAQLWRVSAIPNRLDEPDAKPRALHRSCLQLRAWKR